MAANFMAYPELRAPFERTPIHADGSATVLYQGRSVTLSDIGDGNALLIAPSDLPRVNGFELKPEGACYGDLCVPLRDGLIVEQNGREWFDLTAFADLMGQAYVRDADARVWSFAEMPAKRDGMMVDAKAPDLTLTDRKGNRFQLADLKGKKALIVTWSSW